MKVLYLVATARRKIRENLTGKSATRGTLTSPTIHYRDRQRPRNG